VLHLYKNIIFFLYIGLLDFLIKTFDDFFLLVELIQRITIRGAKRALKFSVLLDNRILWIKSW